MPFASKAQQAMMNAHPEMMGASKLAEWNAASKGKMGGKPEHVRDVNDHDEDDTVMAAHHMQKTPAHSAKHLRHHGHK